MGTILDKIYEAEHEGQFDTGIPLKPLNGRVFVAIHDDGSVVGKGLVQAPDDAYMNRTYVKDAKHRGIRPRWGYVVSWNSEDPGLGIGTKVLMEMGEWSRPSWVEIGNRRYKVWSIPVSKIMGIGETNENDIRMIENSTFVKDSF